MSKAAEDLVLVINSGSSSIKYQLLDPESSAVAASGIVERIGEDVGRIEHHDDGETSERPGRIADHTAGLRLIFEAFAATGHDLVREGCARSAIVWCTAARCSISPH